jgi:hypothetical protein
MVILRCPAQGAVNAISQTSLRVRKRPWPVVGQYQKKGSASGLLTVNARSTRLARIDPPGCINMSSATITIAYDGPALRDHAMDVRDLAPAMLGLGQLFDAANSALNGDNAQIKVRVKATEPGCFQITFEVIQTLGKHLIALLAGPTVTAAANLVGLLVGVPAGTIGLIGLIRFLKGGKFDKVDSLPAGMVRLTIGDEHIDIPLALLRLYQDVAVRTATQKVIEEPLKRDGMESFEVREHLRVIVRITRKEAPYFAKPNVPDATLVDDIRRSAFSIISLAFKEDNKWRLNDGANAISATIEDEDFLSRVDANQIAFSKGDILICDVRVLQKQTDAGLKTEYTVVRVVEHRPAVRQLPLPLQGGGIGPGEQPSLTPPAETPSPPEPEPDQPDPRAS